MKIINLITIVMILVILNIMEIEGACPTSHAIVHNGLGSVIPQCSPSASCIHKPKFWCLSGGSGNNNGSYELWWNGMYFNGDWNALGVIGCCGMWDATSFDSKTMMAIVEIAYNEGSVNHAGYTDVEVAEAGSGGFYFTRSNNLVTQPIPRPSIDSFSSTGPGGKSTFVVKGFTTGYAPVNYWVIRQDGSSGNNLSLNPICSPGGTSACPPPIEGYRIVGITRGCADGTCNNPAPSPPTTSFASQWNLVIANSDIQGRVPTFPVGGFEVTNPDNENPSNAYMYFATVMLYGYNSAWGGRVAGVYTSSNSIAYKWGLLGSEITLLEAGYISAGRVRIRWKSVAEGNVASYNVYRSYDAKGTYTRVNARTIPAKGIDGTMYTYKDLVILSVPRDIYYRIEIVYHNGSAVLQSDIAVVKARP